MALPSRFTIPAIAALFALVTALSLWALPAPHTAFHYLLAGTVATAVSLLALFVVCCRAISRTGRRSDRPS